MVNTGNAPNNIDNINDLWYALNQGGLLSDTISDDVDDAIKTRNYAVQPDGDLVGEKASGEVFTHDGNLDAGETFTSDWFDTDGFSALEIYVSASVPSEVGGVEIQHTKNVQQQSPNADAEHTRTYDTHDTERGFRIFRSESILDGFRFVYKNGSTATDISIVATARTGIELDGAGYVYHNQDGNNVIRVGTERNGQGLKIGTPTSLFGDLATVGRTTIIDQTSSFGTSSVRDEIISTGSGSVTEDPDVSTGEIAIGTGTTADSSIELRTAEYGRYTPGFSAQQGVGIRIPDPPTEGEAKWGYFDDDNGFYWGYDGDQEELFVARLRNGTETERTYRSNWNRHNPDNVFDRTFDVTEGSIFQIDFSWYGYGIIQFSVISQTTDDIETTTPKQSNLVVHSISVNGETSISDPNQPITVRADNGTSGEDYEVRIGGRQFSVFGQEPSGQRITSHDAVNQTVADGSWTHLMTWRRNASGISNARLNLDGMDFGCDQTTKLALVINANVSGLSFGTPELTNTDETLLEVSTAGTFDGIGDGNKVWGGTIDVPGQGNAQAGADPEIDLNLGQSNTVSFIAQAVGSTANATTTMRLTEDW